MKNVIKYYYNFEVTNIRQVNTDYYLLIDDNNYLLCKCNEPELKSMIKYLVNNYNFHKIIPTIGGNISIIFNDITYVLLKINTPNRKINIEDIYSFNYPIPMACDSIPKWINLWTSHIDYIEYQINELSSRYPILSRFIYYYIGLAENAIELLNTIDVKNTYNYISHKRITSNTTLVDLYNPTFTILDSKVRDVAEYYKSIFFESDISIENILSKIYFALENFNESETKLFFARMLYPTYFFDVYDKIMEYNIDEKIIYSIINRSNAYEKLLSTLYESIKKTTYIENIDWL